MKQTTKEWLTAAEDDLLSAKKLINEERLTNIVAFHCQQCLEKSFKAMIEEQEKKSIKSHDLLRLKDIANFELSENNTLFIATINEVYIDSRYPGDMGLMPQGKPTLEDAKEFIEFTEAIFYKIIETLNKK
ncbi:MAG: HEPN domain-containing protein [Prolixibacteraceae bacterium]|nr:HEPN domain-containing protein [Prolixibacteraceae bacterium]